MRRFASIVIVLAVAGCSGGKKTGGTEPSNRDAPAAAPMAAALPAAFATSLRDAHMTFEMPAGYTQVAPVDNPHWQYAFAMQSADGAMEIRIRIDPLAAALAEHDKCVHTPGCAGTDPNKKWHSWLFVIAANIGGGKPDDLPQVVDLPASDAATYGADAAAGAILHAVDPAFHARQHQAMIVILHKDNVADAVVAVLSDKLDGKAAEQAIKLRFAP